MKKRRFPIDLTCVCAIVLAVFSVGAVGRAQQSAPEQATRSVSDPASPLEILTPHPGVSFATFGDHLIQVVKRNWWAKMPDEAKKWGKGNVVVRFGIQSDGALSDKMPTVEVSSGTKSLDDAAIEAVRASAPFEHLPDPFKGPNIEVRLNFYYNVPMPGQHP